MANTLSSFLIGIGLDFDTKGAKEAESSLNSIKSSALQAATAVAGAFGVKAVTADVANRVRTYSLLAEQIGSTAQAVDALDRVYQRAGGGAGEVVGQLQRIKDLQAQLQVGGFEWIPEAARAGINTGSIQGEADPVDAYRNVISQLEKLSVNSRRNAIKALGLDPAAINLAIDGIKEYDKQFDKAIDRNSFNAKLEKDSDIFAKNWFDMWDNVEGITTRAGAQIIPEVNKITGSVNEFFEANRNIINSGADAIFGEIAKNLDLVAIAAVALSASSIGSVLSVMASKLPLIGAGAGKLATVAKSLGQIGLAYAAISFVTERAGKGGDYSASALFGENDLTRMLDKPFNEYFIDEDGNNQLSSGRSRANNRGTVISPSDVTTPVSASSGKEWGNRVRGVDQRSVEARQKRQIVVNVSIGAHELKQQILEILDDEDEQTLKDLRSSVDR